MLRRWYVTLGLLLCAGFLWTMLAQDGGTYSTRTVISFMLPARTTLSPANGTTDSSIIAFASTVVREANDGQLPPRYSLDDAPYYGAGIREGTRVELANEGNQWASTFNKAEVQVLVVGRTLDWVESRQRQLVGEILSIADSRQAAIGIPPRERIVASVVPLTSGVEYIFASRTAMLTAGAALFGAAIILGSWGSVMMDRRGSLRRQPSPGIRMPAGRTAEGLA
jgi:hypothetical protein